MTKFILGLLVGIIGTCLLLNLIPWSIFFTPTVLKAGFAVFLALIGGLIALFQVKANVISTARIKWIEEFKINIAEYASVSNEIIFSYREHSHSKDKDIADLYYQKYMECVHKSMTIKGKIYMNLNLKEHLYTEINKIIQRIEILTDHTNLEFISEEENYHKISDEFDNLNSITHKAMKVEWDKSKKMLYWI
ncbi:MAG: hypothetical protein V4548_07615 [Bacteroidota bacterium]